jgi:hypothetical protein
VLEDRLRVGVAAEGGRERRGGHRNELFAEEERGLKVGPASGAVADGDVDLAVAQVHHAVVGGDVEEQIRRGALEGGEPGQEPEPRERRHHADPQRVNAAVGPPLLRRARDGGERLLDGADESLTGRGEARAASVALEQGRAQPRFDDLDAAADRAVGQAELLGGVGEGAAPGGRRDGEEAIEWWEGWQAVHSAHNSFSSCAPDQGVTRCGPGRPRSPATGRLGAAGGRLVREPGTGGCRIRSPHR